MDETNLVHGFELGIGFAIAVLLVFGFFWGLVSLGRTLARALGGRLPLLWMLWLVGLMFMTAYWRPDWLTERGLDHWITWGTAFTWFIWHAREVPGAVARSCSFGRLSPDHTGSALQPFRLSAGASGGSGRSSAPLRSRRSLDGGPSKRAMLGAKLSLVSFR
jgi:hypothetical protein